VASLLLSGAVVLTAAIGAAGPAALAVAAVVKGAALRPLAVSATVAGVFGGAALLLPLPAAATRPLFRLLGLPVPALVGVSLLLLAVAGGVGAWLAWDVVAHIDLAPLAAGLLGLLALPLALHLQRGPLAGRARRALALSIGLALVAVGALGAGRVAGARRVVFDGTPLARVAWAGAMRVSELDLDGYSSLLGGGDCRPFDPAINPGAREIPGNGVDENCFAGDGSGEGLEARSVGPTALPPGFARPKNLLLISIDSVRADHVGFMGYERQTTPHLDHLAAQAVVFERFHAHTPATRWSIPMLHTSRWPSHLAWNKKTFPHVLRSSETTLAERLKKAGFRTGAVWPFTRTWGLHQGFSFWRAGKGRKRLTYAHQIAKHARVFLDRDDGRPWFLWLHFYDPHHPYRSRKEGREFGRRPIDRFDSEIRAVDAEISRLLARLGSRRGRREQTAIVVVADHGEEFMDHGGRAHKNRLYQELLHIPCLIAVPGLRPGRTRSGAGLLDLTPTLLDLVGHPLPAGTPVEGRSLVPDLLGEREHFERPIYASLSFFPTDGQKKRSVLVGDHKLIFDVKIGARELYHLPSDPKEREDLSVARPQVTADLMRLVLTFIDHAGSYDGRRALNATGSSGEGP